MSEIKNTLWVEKYRPSSLDSYIGNEHLRSKVKVYIESGDLPHLLLYGKAGTGKTTLAKLLVNNIECDCLYINASDENSVDVVREKVKNFASTLGFKEMKVIILDECDYITPNAQAALRNLMETFSKNCRFILTCNYVERIIDPIQSRCQSLQIVPPDRKQVVNGELIIDEGMSIQNDYKNQVLDILKTQDKKNAFKNIRQLLADSKVTDFSDLFRLMFDTVDDWGRGHIAECILILAQYQQSDAVVVDKEINIMAMFIEIIGKVK